MAISLSTGELLALIASARLCPLPTPVTWRLSFRSGAWPWGGRGGGVGVGVWEDKGVAMLTLVGEWTTLLLVRPSTTATDCLLSNTGSWGFLFRYSLGDWTKKKWETIKCHSIEERIHHTGVMYRCLYRVAITYTAPHSDLYKYQYSVWNHSAKLQMIFHYRTWFKLQAFWVESSLCLSPSARGRRWLDGVVSFLFLLLWRSDWWAQLVLLAFLLGLQPWLCSCKIIRCKSGPITHVRFKAQLHMHVYNVV